jgi:rhodanese-related sulfurtransferase
MREIKSYNQLIDAIKTQVDTIDINQLKQKLDADEPLLLIDVREDREWFVANIPTAIHLSRGVIEKFIKKYASDIKQPIYLYCRSGHRSLMAAQSLMQMGYQHVFSIKGGISEWAMFGYPLEEQVLKNANYWREKSKQD